MSNILEVNGLKIGAGTPKICVPLTGSTDALVLEEAKKAFTSAADLIEWRLDLFTEIANTKKILELLKEIKTVLGAKPLLVTIRTSLEGSALYIATDKYIELNKALLESGSTDLIDLELSRGEAVVKDLVHYAHEHKVLAIVSRHTFDFTPRMEVIVNNLKQMQKLGADIVKFAAMPKEPEDVLTLLSATNVMQTEYKNTPVITMSMGNQGKVSRIAGETFGSAVTFGALDNASAPGQIPVEELAQILKGLTQ